MVPGNGMSVELALSVRFGLKEFWKGMYCAKPPGLAVPVPPARIGASFPTPEAKVALIWKAEGWAVGVPLGATCQASASPRFTVMSAALVHDCTPVEAAQLSAVVEPFCISVTV